MTAESLKVLLSSPTALFFLMLVASVANGAKQVIVVKQTGQSMTCLQYWAHVPETLIAITTNVIAFWVLILTDQLNFASALAVGYGANSLADLLPKGRSYALKKTPDDPSKVETP
jgi:hypothetical protein